MTHNIFKCCGYLTIWNVCRGSSHDTLKRIGSCPIGKNWYFQHWKWNAFSLILPYFLRVFFANREKATKFKEASKFRQEMLNILCVLKFSRSHLAFYEWKVSFSLISLRIFLLGWLRIAVQEEHKMFSKFTR